MAANKSSFESELNALMKNPNIETVEQYNAELVAIVDRFVKSGTVTVQVNGQTAPVATGVPAQIVNQPGVGSWE